MGNLMFPKKTAWDIMHEQAHCQNEAASHRLPIAAAFWIIWMDSMEEYSSLMQKSDADSLFYLLSHFECEGHTAHVLTHRHLPPPLTSAVKLSLFTHALSSLLSLAARVHPCHANHSLYINHCQTFSWQTSYFNYINTILLALYFWIKLLKDDIPILSLFGLVDMYYLSS